MCICSTFSHTLWSGSEGMLSLHCSSWSQGICHSSIYRLQRKCCHHSRLGLSLEPELWLEAQLHSQWYWIHVIAATICLDACICMLVYHAGTMWTRVMEHGHMDTKTILDLSKLLTSTQNTVLHMAWPRITAVHQRAVAAPKGAAAPCIEWLILATTLKIAGAMDNLTMEHCLNIIILLCCNNMPNVYGVWTVLHAVLV